MALYIGYIEENTQVTTSYKIISLFILCISLLSAVFALIITSLLNLVALGLIGNMIIPIGSIINIKSSQTKENKNHKTSN